MDLHGLAMVILGPPVEGAETICFANPAARIRRELFLREGKPVGGALIGDISGAGPLHALIAAGLPLTDAQARLLAPGRRNVIPFPDRAGVKRAFLLNP
jgi:NAD(P)H-nitrite reductase large subunit